MGRVKGSGEGAGREKRIVLPSPSPLSFFRPRTYRKGYYFYSPQSSTVIKSKMAATTISYAANRVSPTQNTPALQVSFLMFVCCPFPLTFEMVLMTFMLALMKAYFSLLYAV